jgi:GNAT superfamily N-acetyltransferase
MPNDFDQTLESGTLAFRKFTPADHEFSLELLQANIAPYYAKRFGAWNREMVGNHVRKTGEADYTVVTRGGNPVGLFSVTIQDGAPFIDTLQVVSDEQGKGIGGLCLEAIKTWARASGYDRIRLTVFEENPAKRLYERKGFRVIGQGEDPGELLMEAEA